LIGAVSEAIPKEIAHKTSTKILTKYYLLKSPELNYMFSAKIKDCRNQ